MAIPIKSPDEIDAMRAAGRVLWRILGEVLNLCRLGTSSRDLNAAAHNAIRAAGAEPILLGYTQHGLPPFPGASCICINEEALHAPPSPRILRAGDIVTVDIALRIGGWCADAARSSIVPGDPGAAPPGATPESIGRLLGATRRAIDAAIAAMAPGARWSAVAQAVGAIASSDGFSLIPAYSGHGIGRVLHEPPRAWSARHPDPDRPERDFILRPGMVVTVEPILTSGRPETIVLDDGWTVLTADRAPVCHEERTIAITRGGPVVLTAP